MTELEQAARIAWQGWGSYAQWKGCSGCGAWRYCRSTNAKLWLCLDCFDQR